MKSIFCCSEIVPFKPKILDHESKFTAFIQWAKATDPIVTGATADDIKAAWDLSTTYVLQLVRQVNYGPLESKRYFLVIDNSAPGSPRSFVEVLEKGLIEANFQKLNSFKNFRCSVHDRFFEMNIYQKDPTNTHHWRANVARPAGEIDL